MGATTSTTSTAILRVATHSGPFHADDALALAIIKMATPVVVSRTRDVKVLAAADVCIDVGGKYVTPAEAGGGQVVLDHHQRGGAGSRVAAGQEVPYASAGLVWHHYGHQAVSVVVHQLGAAKLVDIDAVWRRVEQALVAPVDAPDNGLELATGYVADLRPATFSAMIAEMNPGWLDEAPDYGRAFDEAVAVAERRLRDAIRSAVGAEAAPALVRQALAARTRPEMIVLPRFCPWQETVLAEASASSVLYVLFKDTEGNWIVQCVPDALGSFGKRKALPAAWAGLRDAALDAVTGVPGGVFCHTGRFVAGHRTKEGALAMAELAIRA